MPAPVYNPATDTVVFVGDSSAAYIADMTAAGAVGAGPRIYTHPSLQSNGGAESPNASLVVGKGGTGKALSMLYPAGSTIGYALDWVIGSPAVPPTDPTATQYIRFVSEFLDADGSQPLPIKFVRLIYPETPGGSAPQWSTHYRVASQSAATDHVTYWQFFLGGDDPEGDQSTQPVAPYYNSVRNTYGNYLIEFRPHTTEKEADGVTPATLSFTPSSPGTVGTGGTFVCSKSLAGKLAVGQKIGIKAFAGSGGNKLYGGWTINSFDGDKTFTATPILSNMWAPAAGTLNGLRFSISLDGCSRLYLNDTKIQDTSLAAVGVIPPGGDKQWCSMSQVAQILTEAVPLSTGGVVWFGGDYSSNVAAYDRTMLVNVGNNDPTNPDSLLWFTRPYSAVLPGPADHLAVTRQPSGAVSGVTLTQQPIVEIRDTGNSIATSYTGRVRAILVSGNAQIIGDTVYAVNGIATFTTLRLDGTGPQLLGFVALDDPTLDGVVSNVISMSAGTGHSRRHSLRGRRPRGSR